MEYRNRIEILIAESDEDHRMFIDRVLKTDPNVQGRFAKNEKELLDSLRYDQPPPDMILLGIEQPLMGGRDVVNELQSPRYRDIPVVCLTTFADARGRSYCLKKGAKEYIEKPSSFQELSEMLKKIICKWVD